MKTAVSAFVAGLIFAIGLTIGGMTLPNNVIGFLDVTGVWKPSLIFVMGGAILVFSIGYRLIIKRPKPVLDSEFHIPNQKQITPRLVIGSAFFGVGWGLSGFCPGPALTAVGAGSHKAILFTVFMILGMLLQRFAFSK